MALGDHIGYFWQTPEEFVECVGFLKIGLRADDHCVIFGHRDANARVCAALHSAGFDIEALKNAGRLTVLGGLADADALLSSIGKVFARAVERGAPLLRLLGNIGWGEADWPAEKEILAFEAKVTGAAKEFPSVVVCMYDVDKLPGRVIVHGALETHPLTFRRNILRENPLYVDRDDFLAGLE